MSEVLLSMTEVRKSFGEEVPIEVLHGIDLQLMRKQMVALVGPSGSGKSTLLNLMGLLDRPTTGRIEIKGDDIKALDDAALTSLRGRFLGFIFQFHHLLPGLSVLENVMLPSAALQGGFERTMEKRALELLTSVGLGDRADSWPKELSGGMQQRVAIARALMNDPPLVLADEPTGNLDTETGDTVFELLQEQNRQHETAFLIVTHDENVARRCERVIRIVDGRIVGDGPPEEVIGGRS